MIQIIGKMDLLKMDTNQLVSFATVSNWRMDGSMWSLMAPTVRAVICQIIQK